MFELICGSTAALCCLGAFACYAKARDAMHPGVFLAPLFGYFYGVWPLLMNYEGDLQAMLDTSYLNYASVLFITSIAALYAGLMTGGSKVHREQGEAAQGALGALVSSGVSPDRLRKLAMVLGMLSVTAYFILLENAGGFVEAYSRAKGGGRSGGFGYLGEAVLLSFPAILILGLSANARGGRVGPGDALLALLFALPHLIQGVLGTRRGPLFLILATLLMAWIVARGRRPSLPAVFVGVVMIGLTVLVVYSQRQNIYLGSEEEFDSSRLLVADGVSIGRIEPGNSYVAAVSKITAVDFYGDYYWGYRYFVTFVIRPIPRQIWPSKYRDMGATWLEQERNDRVEGRFSSIVDFSLPRGVAGGSIADGYEEFAWGVLLLLFLLGRALAYVYWRHRGEGGFWTVMLMLMLALSVYLPSQSFSAWMHRLMFMSVFAWLFWRLLVGPISLSASQSDRGRGSAPAPAE